MSAFNELNKMRKGGASGQISDREARLVAGKKAKKVKPKREKTAIDAMDEGIARAAEGGAMGQISEREAQLVKARK